MSRRLKPLSQQTIVVTGASSGIGLATARLAAARGSSVVMVARNVEALDEAAEVISAEGGRAAVCVADVGDSGWPEAVGEVAAQKFGGFDSWINNAAVALYAPVEEVTEEENRRVFDVGYFGTVAGSLYAARKLRERGGGAIINVGSVLSERAIPLQGTYAAMKHAVLGFTEALRMELARADAPISVTLIKPNGIDTPYPEHARNKMSRPASIPPIRYDPALVARAICFACETPRRELLVGGQGVMITQLGNLFPATLDKVMEAMMGDEAQTTVVPPEPGADDNLFEPRKDGRMRSNQGGYVRKRSYALEAQMHPVASILAGLSAAAVGAAAIIASKAVRR
ncbi:SDR family oxidoreductase [Tsuneonella sp. HG249]